MTITASSTPEATVDSTFVCECGEVGRSACLGEPFYKEYKGGRYCILHFPSSDKDIAYFNKVLERKLSSNDYNFCRVWFPDNARFFSFRFTKEVDFRSATFSGQAIFFNSTFEKQVSFRAATFMAEVEFAHATFKGPSAFNLCKFNAGVDFRFIQSQYMNFFSSIFGGYIKFATKEKTSEASIGLLDLQFARIEQPERVSFHTLTLRPHWFVNVDVRKFVFTDVYWEWLSTNEEIRNLSRISSPHHMLSIACRHLAVNAEENQRYEEASKFRYMAMDAQRLQHWRGFAFWKLSWWYWLASGYGERIFKAFIVLIGIWLLSTVLYTYVGFARWEPKRSNEGEAMTERRDEVGEPLKLSRALTYSLGVMVLQKPEPRPATTAGQSFVILETILGPLQAALLALAIRRKFMR